MPTALALSAIGPQNSDADAIERVCRSIDGVAGLRIENEPGW